MVDILGAIPPLFCFKNIVVCYGFHNIDKKTHNLPTTSCKFLLYYIDNTFLKH